MADRLAMLGQWALDRLGALGSFVLLFFSLLSRMGPVLRRGRLIAAQTHFLGNHSLAIILVSGLFVGLVLG
ncbi:MAG: ABC transporter permease, partial [Burkholderiaceae bacterium]